MPPLVSCALNSLVPGSGLVLRRRLLPGLSLLIPALALVSVGIVGLCERDDPALQVQGALAMVAYLVCASVAAVLWWWIERPVHIDQAQVQTLYRAAATAYLTNQLEAADRASLQLTRLLPNEAGSWRLLELIARARGSLTEATAAGQRAKRLDTSSTQLTASSAPHTHDKASVRRPAPKLVVPYLHHGGSRRAQSIRPGPSAIL